MSLEDFIRNAYGSRTSASTLNEAYTMTERRIETRAKAKKDTKRPTLAEQRSSMQERRADYSSMIQAGVIPDTKTGVSLVKKIEDKKTRPEVTRYMSGLNDRQIAMLSKVVDRRISSLPFFIRGGARNVYEGMVKSSREMRADSGLVGEGTNIAQVNTGIGFNMGNAIDLGKSMFDKKGFDLELKKGSVGVTYRKNF